MSEAFPRKTPSSNCFSGSELSSSAPYLATIPSISHTILYNAGSGSTHRGTTTTAWRCHDEVRTVSRSCTTMCFGWYLLSPANVRSFDIRPGVYPNCWQLFIDLCIYIYQHTAKMSLELPSSRTNSKPAASEERTEHAQKLKSPDRGERQFRSKTFRPLSDRSGGLDLGPLSLIGDQEALLYARHRCVRPLASISISVVSSATTSNPSRRCTDIPRRDLQSNAARTKRLPRCVAECGHSCIIRLP